MKRCTAVLCLAMLAGCDEPTIITHVDKLPGVSGTDLRAMQDSQGIPVEVHGAPFGGVDAASLAAALRAPAGLGAGIRFYAVAPGSVAGRHATRLVLHFNPAGPPNAQADCRRTAPAATGTAPAQGFSVNASFCRDRSWQAHGFMRVLEIRSGDLDGYSRTMTTLMQAIFREEPDR